MATLAPIAPRPVLRQIAADDTLFFARALPGKVIVETAAFEWYVVAAAPLNDDPRQHWPYLHDCYTLEALPERIGKRYRAQPLPPTA